jgi:serine/threonine-protein kinase RsbW
MNITDTRFVTLTSVKENVSLVERFVDEICQYYSIGDENYGNILIAVTEAVNNAIFHGSRRYPS